ncbi:MAG: DHHW family protein [Oscillospiraceae bacterium]|nr:DHHW family protein [Oscillospiraceae bacterium]
MYQQPDRLNIVLSLAAIALLSLFVFILPTDEKASEFENRAMGSFPELNAQSYFSGEFSRDYETFLLDNTANRTTWLTFAQFAENTYGINRQGAMMVEFDVDDLGIGLIPDEISEAVVFTTSGANVNPNQPFSVDIHFNENAIFYLRYTENQELASRYAEVLNAYAEALPNNTRMFSLISPVKVEFMSERYASVNSSQIDTIKYINALLNDEIIPVDAHKFLSEHSDEYIFFRTDHHWTALGAYYAYLAFAEAAGLEPVTIDNYIENAIEGFIGSLAVGTRNRMILSHPDTVYFYTLNDGTEFSINMFTIPSDLSILSYRLFLGGDRDYYSFNSSNKNGRTLVAVKDSFANAMLPWLAPHYETVAVIDPRQFTGSVMQILEEYDDIDLLFINYIPATTMSDLIEQTYNAK